VLFAIMMTVNMNKGILLTKMTALHNSNLCSVHDQPNNRSAILIQFSLIALALLMAVATDVFTILLWCYSATAATLFLV